MVPYNRKTAYTVEYILNPLVSGVSPVTNRRKWSLGSASVPTGISGHGGPP